MSIHIPSLKSPAASSVVDRRLRLLAGRGGAEAASIAASFGALHFAENHTPESLAALKDSVAKQIVAPNLAAFDKMADKMPGFEGKEGVAERQALPPDERAKYYADGLVDYSVMVAGSLSGQMVAQSLLDHLMGLPMSGTFKQKAGKMALATTVDRGVQIGATLLLTAVTPELTEKLQHFTAQHIVKKFGDMTDDEAEEKARALVTINLPNLAGWAGSIGFLDKIYAKELANVAKRI